MGHHGRRRAHLPSRFEVLDAEGRVGCGIAGSTSPCRETGKAGRGSRKKSKNKKADSSGNRTRVCTVAGYYSTTRPTSLYYSTTNCRIYGQLVGTFCTVRCPDQLLISHFWGSSHPFPSGLFDGRDSEFTKHVACFCRGVPLDVTRVGNAARVSD